MWSATLDAPTLSLTGVRLPEDAEEVETEQDRTADRAANWLARAVGRSTAVVRP